MGTEAAHLHSTDSMVGSALEEVVEDGGKPK